MKVFLKLYDGITVQSTSISIREDVQAAIVKRDGKFRVYEISTGYALGAISKTKKGAIESANACINAYSGDILAKDAIDKIIEEFLELHPLMFCGIAPWSWYRRSGRAVRISPTMLSEITEIRNQILIHSNEEIPA